MVAASVRASPLACCVALSLVSSRALRLPPSDLSDARLELADHAADGLAVGAGGEGQRHAVLEHRLGQRDARRRSRAQAARRAARGRAPPASAPGWRAGPGPRRSACRARRSPARDAPSAPARGSPRPPLRRPAGGAPGAARRSARRRSSPASACVSSAPVVSNRMRARPRGRDSRRRSASGSGRAAPRAADRCLPARSGSASRARGTGAGRSWRSPATVTCCSCIACSSADWVRGLARLISSAISSWAKIGPGMKRKLRLPPGLSSSTSEPRMSDGIRSGVNWMRRASRPSTMPRVSTSLVLARPGTPTSSAWPPDSTVMSACSTTFSWPKMTLPIAALAAATCAAGRFRRADDHVFELLEPFAAGCRHFIAPCHRTVIEACRPEPWPGLCPKMQHSGQVSHKVSQLRGRLRANSAQVPKDYAIFHRRDAAFLQVCHRPDTGRAARAVNVRSAGLFRSSPGLPGRSG